MVFKIGSTLVSKAYLGNAEAQKVYIGSNLVHEVGGGSGPAFDPSTVSGMQTWCDMSLGEEVGYDANPVTVWYDQYQTDGGNPILQGSASLQPSVSSINGLDAWHTDSASGQNMMSLDSSDAELFPDDLSIFIAYQPEDTSGYILGSPTGSSFLRLDYSGSILEFRVSDGTNDYTLTSAVTISTATPHVLVMRSDGTNLYLQVDDNTEETLSASTWVASTAELPDLRIGSLVSTVSMTDAKFGEFLTYNTAVSDSDKDDIVAYLMDKWGA